MAKKTSIPACKPFGSSVGGVSGHKSSARSRADMARAVHCGQHPESQVTALHALENLHSEVDPICVQCKSLLGKSCTDLI